MLYVVLTTLNLSTTKMYRVKTSNKHPEPYTKAKHPEAYKGKTPKPTYRHHKTNYTEANNPKQQTNN